MFLFKPCPECCCIIAEDRFNRTDETPLASPWTKLSGTAANLSGNRVVKGAGSGCSYRHDTVYPGATTESQHASARFKIPSGGGTVKIRCGMTDDSNYFAAILYIPSSGCPVLAACARVAGVGCGIGGGAGSCSPAAGESSCINAPAAVVDDWFTLEVCLIPNNGAYGYSTYDEVRAKVTLSDGTVYGCKTSVDGPTVGTYAGWDTVDACEVDDFAYTYFRNSPTDQHRSCPNCNTPSCLIGSDDFTTDITCNWWTVSGSYSVASGQMAITGSSSIQFALPHPLGKSAKIVTALLKWSSSIEARVDLGNGYAIFDSTNRQILLYDSTSTLLTSSAVNSLPASDDAMYAVKVCYYGGMLTATWEPDSASPVCVDDLCTDVSNPFVYLGSDSGTVHFDNFVFSKHYDVSEPADGGCETCGCQRPCENCLNDVEPDYVVSTLPVEIAPCLSCTQFAGSTVLGRRNHFGTTFDCGWGSYEIIGTDFCDNGVGISAYDYWVLVLGPSNANWDGGASPGTYRVRIQYYNAPSPLITWEKDYGSSKPDCMNWQNEEIPWVDSGGGGGACDITYPSAYLTSI